MADVFQILKAQWERFAGHPVIRQVVFEWPDDWGRIPMELVARHPECKTGFTVSSASRFSDVHDQWKGNIGEPLHAGWDFLIETIIESGDEAERKWQQVRHLWVQTCEALARDNRSIWFIADDVVSSSRLTAEILLRLNPRRMDRLKSPLTVVDHVGRRSQWSEPQWEPGTSNAMRPHYRSWCIDDLVAGAALTIAELLASPDDADWMTVTEAAQASGALKQDISRAADKGDLVTNGKTNRERRISKASIAEWQLQRARGDT